MLIGTEQERQPPFALFTKFDYARGGAELQRRDQASASPRLRVDKIHAALRSLSSFLSAICRFSRLR